MRPTPCGDFQPGIQAAIDWFKVHEIIKEEESNGVVRGQHLQDRRSHRLAAMIDLNLGDDDENDQRMYNKQQARKLLLNTSRASVERLIQFRQLILPDVRSVYRAVVALASIVDVEFVSQEEMVDRISSGPNVESSLNRLE